MNNFDFRNPTHILFGKGRIADLKERTGSLGNMLFVAFESRYVNQRGVPVAQQRGTYIYYQPSAVSEG